MPPPLTHPHQTGYGQSLLAREQGAAFSSTYAGMTSVAGNGPTSDISDAISRDTATQSNGVIDFLSDPTVQRNAGYISTVLTAGTTALGAAAGGMGAVASGLVGASVIVGAGLGMLAFAGSSWLGEKVSPAFAWLLGMQEVATDGDRPATKDDEIAHQAKSLSLWGTIAGVVVGAAAAFAVGALIIGTGGLAGAVIAGLPACDRRCRWRYCYAGSLLAQRIWEDSQCVPPVSQRYRS